MVAHVQADHVDFKRQSCNKNILLSGPGIPPPFPDEDPHIIMCKLVKEEFNIDLSPTTMSQVHRLGKGIIAEFILRGKYSTFVYILKAAQQNKNIIVYAHIQLQGQDRHLCNIVSGLRKEKKIHRREVDPTSGKICITKNGRTITVNNRADIEKFVK